MKKEKLTAELTDAEIKHYDEAAKAIATSKNISKVHVVVQIDPDTLERKACFLSEPNYQTKISVMDKAANIGSYRAAEELREISVIKDSSDAITYSDSPESDVYKLGVVDYCLGMVSRLQNQFKKK